MAIVCKPEVRLLALTPELMRIFGALMTLQARRFEGWPKDYVITSINDGKHRAGSKHYVNRAADVRSKSFADETAKAAFVDVLRDELGPGYTVLYEYVGTVNEHFHIQSRV